MIKVGIIGGSGLDDPDLLKASEQKTVSTPYGDPSSPLTCGRLNGAEVVLIARHGKKHQFSPTQVNYRANIRALKDQGVTHILATTACGSEVVTQSLTVLPSAPCLPVTLSQSRNNHVKLLM